MIKRSSRRNGENSATKQRNNNNNKNSLHSHCKYYLFEISIQRLTRHFNPITMVKDNPRPKFFFFSFIFRQLRNLLLCVSVLYMGDICVKTGIRVPCCEFEDERTTFKSWLPLLPRVLGVKLRSSGLHTKHFSY